MQHKWIFEIYVNGELNFYNKLTVEQIQKIIKYANQIKKEV